MEWPKSRSEWIELILSLIPSVGPGIEERFSFVLPFLNPKIADDMVAITTVIAFVAGAGTLQLCRRSSTAANLAGLAFVGGLSVAIISLVALMAIALEIVLTTLPGLAQLAARTAYLLLFLGISVSVGGFLGR